MDQRNWISCGDPFKFEIFLLSISGDMEEKARKFWLFWLISILFFFKVVDTYLTLSWNNLHLKLKTLRAQSAFILIFFLYFYLFICKGSLERSRVNYSMVVQRDCPKRKNVFKICDLNIWRRKTWRIPLKREWKYLFNGMRHVLLCEIFR